MMLNIPYKYAPFCSSIHIAISLGNMNIVDELLGNDVVIVGLSTSVDYRRFPIQLMDKRPIFGSVFFFHGLTGPITH